MAMKFSLFIFLLLAAPVAAQTHPCDLPPQTGIQTVTVGAAFTLSFCHNGRDAAGIPVSVTGWKLIRNADAPLDVTPIVTPTSNSTGLTGYSVPRTETSAGSTTYQIYAINGVSTGAKAAVTFTVVAVVGPLTAPTHLRVVQ